MLYFPMGYEAPSTAHENWSHPFVTIGGREDLFLLSLQEFLPESLRLAIKVEPLFCPQTIFISLRSSSPSLAKDSLLNLYADYPPLQGLTLTLEVGGHECMVGGIRKPLQAVPELMLDPSFLFQHPFQTLLQDHILDLNHPPQPYGGVWHPDPAQCHQLFFTLHEHEGFFRPVTEVLATQTPSLSQIIISQKVEISILWNGASYPYRSIAYEVSQLGKLWITVIPKLGE